MKQLVILKKNQKRLIYQKGTEKNRIFFSQKNNYLLQSISAGLITDNQLKAIYNFIRRKLKKSGTFTQHIFTNIGLTKKPVEVRMGKGKGSKIHCYVYPVRPGKILFELQGVNKRLAEDLFKSILNKLAIQGRIINL